jgi:phosphate-selective porin
VTDHPSASAAAAPPPSGRCALIRRQTRIALAGLALVGFGAVGASAQQESADSTPRVQHGDKGFEIETADGQFLFQIQPRLQVRFSYPFDSDPVTLEQFGEGDELSLSVRRARLKVGGHGFRPWLKYYFEYELASAALLNFEVMVQKYESLSLRVGQWKVEYNRERMISSGKQQTLDRSILTYPFTVDRQQGISLFGRLRGEGIADFTYAVGMFSGSGRGGQSNDDTAPMFVGRLQWNPLGDPVPMSGSDLQRHQDPVVGVALAGATNRSRYTRFSQSGGGQLPGFGEGVPGQYRVNQAVLETAAMWKGLSWQQELHWKEIEDRENVETTRLMGNPAQLGYFPSEIWSSVPSQLEFAFRHAIYDPDRDTDDLTEQEVALAVNWFFSGHANKLTAEVAHIELDQTTAKTGRTRVRVQWDISF